jgi:hypothetical protein
MNQFSHRLVVGALLVCGGASAFAAMTYGADGGKLSLAFDRSLLNQHGLGLEQVKATAQGTSNLDSALGFASTSSSALKWDVNHRMFQAWRPGSATFAGGFTLVIGKDRVRFSGIRLVPGGEAGNSTFEILSADAKSTPYRLEARHISLIFDDKVMSHAEAVLAISRDMAFALNRPDLAGVSIGTYAWETKSKFLQGQNAGPEPDATPLDSSSRTPGQDVGLYELSSLAQFGRVGTYPNGTIGMAALTTSCNEGTQEIAWEPPQSGIGQIMNVKHPVISQSIYREGWVKHGFAATNASGCVTSGCTPPPINPPVSTSWRLRPGCTDTYGASLNASRTWLGPKEEINPFTGVWTAEGSYFSGGVMDRIRRTNGSNKYNPATNNSPTYSYGQIENRIPVADSDFVSGMTLLYEAYYVSENDPNIYNSIGYRQTSWTVNTTSGAYTFSSTTPLTQGALINTWGDMRAFALPRNEGDVIVAVRVTPNGANFDYDYAVMNMNMDRQIKSFSIPVDYNRTVSNISFRDTDKTASNDWVGSFSNGAVTFGTQGGGGANALIYHKMYNFRFTTNVGPTLVNAAMLPVKSGINLSFAASVNGPTPGAIPVSGTVGLDVGYVGGNQPLVATLRPASGGPSITTSVMHNAAAGTFDFSTTARGSYFVSLDGSSWLKRETAAPVTISGAGPTTGISLNLPNGDADESGEVAPGDLQLILDNFGNMVDVRSDLDRDGECGPGDLQIVLDNFGLSDI